MKKNILKKVLGLLISFVFTLGLVLTINTGETQAATVSAVYKGVDYSAVFNYQYYYKMYPDLQKAIGYNEKNLFSHFINFGMKEGRIARQCFNVQYYMTKNNDLKNAFGKDLKKYYIHYINFGKREGRQASSETVYLGYDYAQVYNKDYYYSHNKSDLVNVGYDSEKLIIHFITVGMDKGMRASENFDMDYYKYANKDLKKAYGNSNLQYYIHYLTKGYKEGRNGSSTDFYKGVDYSLIYSKDYYYSNNYDLQKAFGYNTDLLLQHFINFGMKEGRQGKLEFSCNYYKNSNADLLKAFGNNNRAYYTHYVSNGYKEGRKGNTKSNYNGWNVVAGNRVYYSNGTFLKGWKTLNGLKYYFSDKGILKGVPGIDVSKYQGQIDWDAVKNAGVEFAIIRVGWGNNLTYQDDITAIRNMQECERLGIPYGVYLYSYALNLTEAQSEVEHTLRMINGFNPTLGVFIDIEDTKYYNEHGFPTNEMLNNIAILFNEKITAAGYISGTYANSSYYKNHLTSTTLNNYTKWLAEWYTDYKYFGQYKFWQYSSKGSIEGISGNVDMDVMFIN